MQHSMLHLELNFIAGYGGGGGFKIIGTEGAMEVDSRSVKLTRAKLNMIPASYSMISHTEESTKKNQRCLRNKKILTLESLL